jgi:hypothetical protein
MQTSPMAIEKSRMVILLLMACSYSRLLGCS